MLETRIFFMELIPETLGHQRFYSPVMFHDEGFIREQGEGWVPVSHTITPTGDGSALLAIMCTRNLDTSSLENIASNVEKHDTP